MTQTIPLRVLMIEDSVSDAGLLQRELERNGYAVTAQRVETREELLAALQTGPWDVIFGDYSMPHFNGLEALKTIQEQNSDTPFIFVSGTVGEDTAVLAMREGAADYLLKDRLGRLGAAVAQALELKRLQDDRKRTDAQLRLAQNALESAANAIVITNTRGELEWANPAFGAMTGYALAEVTGQNMRFLKSGQHDNAFYGRLWETILAGQAWQGELINRRKDGTVYPEHMTITPVSTEGAFTHFIAVKQDITERKQAEEALQKHAEELERFNRLSVGREERMIELKREVNGLAARLGQPPPYDLSFLNIQPAPAEEPLSSS